MIHARSNQYQLKRIRLLSGVCCSKRSDLDAQDSKSGHGASIPLHSDVVDELRRYLADRPDAHYDDKLFDAPPTIRIFDADCEAAGIPKTDVRGRVIDIHALRHTFGTLLSASGVHPRTAMAAMRHSRMELTMNYYTDPSLLDVTGAVNALPDFMEGKSIAPLASIYKISAR